MDILKQVGTAGWDREKLNMFVHTPASCSAHALRTQLGLLSGQLKCLTHVGHGEREPTVFWCGRIGGTVLTSKWAKKLFSLSGCKASVSAMWLVFSL